MCDLYIISRELGANEFLSIFQNMKLELKYAESVNLDEVNELKL